MRVKNKKKMQTGTLLEEQIEDKGRERGANKTKARIEKVNQERQVLQVENFKKQK